MRKFQRNSISQDSQSLDGLGNAVQEEACSKTLAHGQQWETISWRSIIAFKLIQVSTLLIQLGPARHLNGILIASAFYFFLRHSRLRHRSLRSVNIHYRRAYVGLIIEVSQCSF